MMEKFAGQVILVTGPRGAGKTTLCRRVIDVARQANWKIGGVISPAIIKGGFKVGIGVEDLNSKKRYLLARLPSKGDLSNPSSVTRWVFDPRCLRWGDSVLKTSVPCDLLVVDELGPLELQENKGWQSGLQAVESGQYHLALVVVRNELFNKLLWRWPRANVITVNELTEVDAMVDKIIERLMDLPV